MINFGVLLLLRTLLFIIADCFVYCCVNETVLKANKKQSLFLAYINVYIPYCKTDGTGSRTAQHLGIVVRICSVTARVWRAGWHATHSRTAALLMQNSSTNLIVSGLSSNPLVKWWSSVIRDSQIFYSTAYLHFVYVRDLR